MYYALWCRWDDGKREPFEGPLHRKNDEGRDEPVRFETREEAQYEADVYNSMSQGFKENHNLTVTYTVREVRPPALHDDEGWT